MKWKNKEFTDHLRMLEINISEMARDCELSRGTIYKLMWETKLPTFETAIKVCEYFGKPLERWLDRD
jgi:DNA-binding XRE family transcriptional regulator